MHHTRMAHFPLKSDKYNNSRPFSRTLPKIKPKIPGILPNCHCRQIFLAFLFVQTKKRLIFALAKENSSFQQ